MKADRIYNKAVSELTNLAIERITELTDLVKSESIDVTEYNVDFYNMIVWGNDYSYDGVAAKSFDVYTITFLVVSENIVFYDEEENEVYFRDLPMNSMVFAINKIEEIINEIKHGE